MFVSIRKPKRRVPELVSTNFKQNKFYAMYYSEFTIKLIEEVKKHEILYNTKYEKRPKPEKEEAWNLISSVLNETPDKCKKHWKNVRDRYVKVKHMRDKHFQRGGTELDAPAKYIYFEHLDFMREFSLKKDILVDNTEIVATPSISPFRLLYEESNSEGSVTFCDYTTHFIDVVKDCPELYDEHSELRRYRSKDTWKRISKALDEKFTVGQLRQYWIQLMKRYRVYLENYHKFHGIIENEEIFEELSFASVGIQLKGDQSSDFTVDGITKQEQSFHEEHLVTEEQEGEESSDYEVEMDDRGLWISGLESRKRKRESESEPEPESKKQLTLEDMFSEPALEKPEDTTSLQPSEQQDEFDHYGKKVACALRELAQKDRDLTLKFEMEVLQLVLKIREGLKN